MSSDVSAAKSTSLFDMSCASYCSRLQIISPALSRPFLSEAWQDELAFCEEVSRWIGGSRNPTMSASSLKSTKCLKNTPCDHEGAGWDECEGRKSTTDCRRFPQRITPSVAGPRHVRQRAYWAANVAERMAESATTDGHATIFGQARKLREGRFSLLNRRATCSGSNSLSPLFNVEATQLPQAAR